jgi:C1A family cysteine protease
LLTNASARFNLGSCWTYTTTYSCGGAAALDENRSYSFKAKLR